MPSMTATSAEQMLYSVDRGTQGRSQPDQRLVSEIATIGWNSGRTVPRRGGTAKTQFRAFAHMGVQSISTVRQVGAPH